jgi:hypothetical protein
MTLSMEIGAAEATAMALGMTLGAVLGLVFGATLGAVVVGDLFGGISEQVKSSTSSWQSCKRSSQTLVISSKNKSLRLDSLLFSKLRRFPPPTK